jgi:mRNA interferase MazF
MNQEILYGHLYLADLEPRQGTEPGKTRPVIVIQSDLLNECNHPSTVVVPCTTNIVEENLLRVDVPKLVAGNSQNCQAMVDQIRAIDNRRFVKCLGPIPKAIFSDLKQKISTLLDLE